MKIKEKLELIFAVWKLSFSALIKKPIIVLPLAIGGLIKGIILTILYYYPRKPLSIIAAPILKYYQKEHYLHYPANFILISKVTPHINLIIGIVIVSFFTGWMIYLVGNQILNKPFKLMEGFKIALSRYLSLVAVWMIVILIALGFFKGQGILIRKYFSVHSLFLKLNAGQINQILIFINLFIAALINTIFAFATPSIIFEKKGFLKGVIRSFSLMKTLFLSTYIIILMPTLLSLPMTLLRYNLPKLITRFFPEVTMIVLAIGIVVVFIIDSLVLTSVTTLFILNKETEK